MYPKATCSNNTGIKEKTTQECGNVKTNVKSDEGGEGGGGNSSIGMNASTFAAFSIFRPIFIGNCRNIRRMSENTRKLRRTKKNFLQMENVQYIVEKAIIKLLYCGSTI